MGAYERAIVLCMKPSPVTGHRVTRVSFSVVRHARAGAESYWTTPARQNERKRLPRLPGLVAEFDNLSSVRNNGIVSRTP